MLTLHTPAAVRWLAFHPDGVRLFVLLDRERAVRVWHLDRLRDRLAELGLANGLEVIEPVPVPPPVTEPLPTPPVEEPAPGPNGLRAELFSDMELRHCVKVRVDREVNFRLDGPPGPDPLQRNEHYSLRWSGWLKPPRAGRYTLALDSDDGSRLWLDGKLLIDNWCLGPPVHRVAVELSDQPHALRIEYYQELARAHVFFHWAQEGGFPERPVPASALFHDRAAAEKAVVPAP